MTWEKQWREAKNGELKSKIRRIVSELSAESSPIATLVEEAERRAQVERREWEAQMERWRRAEEERRRAQHIKESREQLFSIIEAWGVAKRIEGFFEDIERRTADLVPEERAALLDQLRLARSLLGGIDALQRFRTWTFPDER